MDPKDIQTLAKFLDYYYPSNEPSSFEELLRGNSPQKSHKIFLLRLHRTCERLGCTIPAEDVNTLWTQVINDCAIKMMRLLQKQGWNSYEYASKAKVVLDGKKALLEMQLEEPAGRKRRAGSCDSDEDVDGSYGKKRKMANGFAGMLASMGWQDGNGSNDHCRRVECQGQEGISGIYADGMDLIPSENLSFGRKIKSMRMNRMAPLAKDFEEDLDQMDLDG